MKLPAFFNREKTSICCAIGFLIFPFLCSSADSLHRLVAKADSFKFVIGKMFFPAPSTQIPGKNIMFSDPDFHTSILRFTDPADMYTGPGIENEYAKADPENANGTFVILRGNDGTWYLYNRANAQLHRQLTAFNDAGQEPEPRWEPSDPDVFYYLSNTELRRYHINNDTSIPVHDFKKDFPQVAYITTGTEGDASLDRRYWCFMLQDKDGILIGVIVYDKNLDQVIGRKTTGFPDAINWVGMDMSGKHCIIGYESLNYPQVFSVDMKKSTALPTGSNAHGDLARTADGRDVFVYQNNATDFISMADLETGVETPLVQIPFDVNPDIGLHVSGNCSATPGWALVSTCGSEHPPAGSAHSWMDAQLFMVELKENPRIWRIAHTHAFTSMDFSGEQNYFAEAFATINTAGTRIYFGSNWGIYKTDYSDTYEILLPDAWNARIPVPVEGIPVIDFHLRAEVNPNPFHDHVTIHIAGTNPARKSERTHELDRPAIEVYDVLGRKIAVTPSYEIQNNSYSVAFNATVLPRGIFLCRIRAFNETIVKLLAHE